MAELVVRVLPDEPAIDKTFDYLVPDELRDQVRVGTMVRIPLHGRRVGAWVLEVGVEPPPGVALRPIAKVTGWGPPADVIDLGRWAAWRWAGRLASQLRTASPPGAVRSLPPPSGSASVPAPAPAPTPQASRRVARVPPGADAFALVHAATRRGNALVVTPSLAGARELAARLRRHDVTVALAPHEWARAAAGATVVGARAAVWAPVRELAAVVVVDEHDEALQQEQAPTWHARTVAIERARRAGVPCLLTSPCPTLEALTWAGQGGLLTPSRTEERAGWPVVDVVDRRRDDPRSGLYSHRLVELLRDERRGRVLCVLNRAGRARLLACSACGELARCEDPECGGAMVQLERGRLRCRRCGRERPAVCSFCGAAALKNLRAGVTRVREELEALAGEPVVEVSAASAADASPRARLYVGTEAVLHQVEGDIGVVAFLDFDQELLVPRYRASEQALALLVRAARLIGGRDGGGRLVIQTRLPKHPVVVAALHADPAAVAADDLVRRADLRFPPFSAMAAVSGAAAPEYIERFGSPIGVDVLGPENGHWLLRAPDHAVLCAALAATRRPPGRLRIEVDPLRI